MGHAEPNEPDSSASRRVLSYDDVLQGARNHFLARGTIVLDDLAVELAVSRATLYRLIDARDGAVVAPATSVNRDGYRALTQGLKGDPENPWSANHLSVRRLSAMTLHGPGTGGKPSVDAVDLRKWAKRSAVGDWAGANADTVGQEIPPQS